MTKKIKSIFALSVLTLLASPVLAAEAQNLTPANPPPNEQIAPDNVQPQTYCRPGDRSCDDDNYYNHYYVCYARDRYDRSFWGQGRNYSDARGTALWYCRRGSPYPGSCYVTYCEERGGYRGPR